MHLDFVECCHIHRLHKVFELRNLLLQKVSTNLQRQRGRPAGRRDMGAVATPTTSITALHRTHLVIFNHTANLQLLDAVCQGNKFGCRASQACETLPQHTLLEQALTLSPQETISLHRPHSPLHVSHVCSSKMCRLGRRNPQPTTTWQAHLFHRPMASHPG